MRRYIGLKALRQAGLSAIDGPGHGTTVQEVTTSRSLSNINPSLGHEPQVRTQAPPDLTDDSNGRYPLGIRR